MVSLLLHEAEPKESVITSIQDITILYLSAQKFTDSKLSSGLSFCHCAQDFVPNCVEIPLCSYKETLNTAYKL